MRCNVPADDFGDVNGFSTSTEKTTTDSRSGESDRSPGEGLPTDRRSSPRQAPNEPMPSFDEVTQQTPEYAGGTGGTGKLLDIIFKILVGIIIADAGARAYKNNTGDFSGAVRGTVKAGEAAAEELVEDVLGNVFKVYDIGEREMEKVVKELTPSYNRLDQEIKDLYGYY